MIERTPMLAEQLAAGDTFELDNEDPALVVAVEWDETSDQVIVTARTGDGSTVRYELAGQHPVVVLTDPDLPDSVFHLAVYSLAEDSASVRFGGGRPVVRGVPGPGAEDGGEAAELALLDPSPGPAGALLLYGLERGPIPQVPGRPEQPYVPGGRRGNGWLGDEVGHAYPLDDADLLACEAAYLSAPAGAKGRMLPVLVAFEQWVWHGINRHGEKIADGSRGG